MLESILGDRLIRLPVEAIRPAPGQARRNFDPKGIEELARSIGENGLLSPVVVRRAGEGFQLIAGERRLRALKLLGEKTATALIRPADDREADLLGLIENLQRQQLHYLEVAQGMKRMMDLYGFSQEGLGRLLGLSQSCVANKLRLLKLPPGVQDALLESGLSERHARALLGLEGENMQLQAARRAAKEAMSVRQLEDMASRMKKEKRPGYRIHLRDHRMLVNAVLGVVKNLNQTGVAATSRVEKFADRIEVVVTLPLGINQERKPTNN